MYFYDIYITVNGIYEDWIRDEKMLQKLTNQPGYGISCFLHPRSICRR